MFINIYNKDILSSIKFPLFVEFNKCLHSNNTISVGIAVCNHLSNFSRSDILFELFCAGNQVFRRYESFVILINVWEYSLNIIFCIFFTGVCRHKLNKLFKTDFSSFINIEVRHGNVDKTSRGIEPTVLFNSFSEVQWSQHSIVIIIEIIKYLFEHLNIFFVCFCSDELFWVKINVSLRVSKATFHFLFRSNSTVFTQSEWSMASPVFAWVSAHIKLSNYNISNNFNKIYNNITIVLFY